MNSGAPSIPWESGGSLRQHRGVARASGHTHARRGWLPALSRPSHPANCPVLPHPANALQDYARRRLWIHVVIPEGHQHPSHTHARRGWLPALARGAHRAATPSDQGALVSSLPLDERCFHRITTTSIPDVRSLESIPRGLQHLSGTRDLRLPPAQNKKPCRAARECRKKDRANDRANDHRGLVCRGRGWGQRGRRMWRRRRQRRWGRRRRQLRGRRRRQLRGRQFLEGTGAARETGRLLASVALARRACLCALVLGEGAHCSVVPGEAACRVKAWDAIRSTFASLCSSLDLAFEKGVDAGIAAILEALVDDWASAQGIRDGRVNVTPSWEVTAAKFRLCAGRQQWQDVVNDALEEGVGPLAA